ncbi:hypothetical protein [Streptomyces sp. NPDC102264]|uniref:hypothetical protein n=1 Tax=Streptomyces sp. NPDC102264 TaxID=3366149 RepID=UPI00381F17E2
MTVAVYEASSDGGAFVQGRATCQPSFSKARFAVSLSKGSSGPTPTDTVGRAALRESLFGRFRPVTKLPVAVGSDVRTR